jgi:hypothetical protein
MTHAPRTIAMLAFLASAVACESKPQSAPPPSSPPHSVHVTAADRFTRNYAQSKLARWHVEASAAGDDCGVLLVQTAIVMDDSMVEALHYGAGAYRVDDRGVYQFYREHSFRGVAYKDPSRKVWTYGDVTPQELEALTPCQ